MDPCVIECRLSFWVTPQSECRLPTRSRSFSFACGTALAALSGRSAPAHELGIPLSRRQNEAYATVRADSDRCCLQNVDPTRHACCTPAARAMYEQTVRA